MSASPVVDSRTIAYRVDRDDTIVEVDATWQRFAEANGWPDAGDVVGRSLWESISGRDTSLIWRELLGRVRQGVAVTVPLRCDSAGARRYLLLSLALADHGAVDFHSTTLDVVERDAVALLAPGTAGGEAIRCCSWCKRFDVQGWVEVEEAVARLGLLEHAASPVTHVMCADCERDVRSSCGL